MSQNAKKDVRDKRVNVPVNQGELDRIRAKAAAADMGVSPFARRALLEGAPGPGPGFQVTCDLARVAAQVDELARWAAAGSDSAMAVKILLRLLAVKRELVSLARPATR